MLIRLAHGLHRLLRASCHLLQTRFIAWTTPPRYGPLRGRASDLTRGKTELVADNALVRQQLIVLQRPVKRPALSRLDRRLLVLLASRGPTWKQALKLVQPQTLLRWHRHGVRLFWKAKSARAAAQPRSPDETRTVIMSMAAENPLWGAERIRGELLKLDSRVSKRPVQKDMWRSRPPAPKRQPWTTFLHHHAHEISRL